MKAEKFTSAKRDGTLEQLKEAYEAFMEDEFWKDHGDYDCIVTLKYDWFGFEAGTDMHRIRLWFIDKIEELERQQKKDHIECTHCKKKIREGDKCYRHEYGNYYCSSNCLLSGAFWGHYSTLLLSKRNIEEEYEN